MFQIIRGRVDRLGVYYRIIEFDGFRAALLDDDVFAFRVPATRLERVTIRGNKWTRHFPVYGEGASLFYGSMRRDRAREILSGENVCA